MREARRDHSPACRVEPRAARPATVSLRPSPTRSNGSRVLGLDEASTVSAALRHALFRSQRAYAISVVMTSCRPWPSRCSRAPRLIQGQSAGRIRVRDAVSTPRTGPSAVADKTGARWAPPPFRSGRRAALSLSPRAAPRPVFLEGSRRRDIQRHTGLCTRTLRTNLLSPWPSRARREVLVVDGDPPGPPLCTCSIPGCRWSGATGRRLPNRRLSRHVLALVSPPFPISTGSRDRAHQKISPHHDVGRTDEWPADGRDLKLL